MEGLAGFLIAALALTGSPGPNTLSLAAVGSAFGRKRGFKYMLGLNLGMVIVIIAVGSGISGLLFAIPMVAPVVITIAAIYFIYLAYKIATAPPLKANTKVIADPKWFEGVMISILNPKAYAAMAALFSSAVLISDNLWVEGFFKAGVLFLVIIAVNNYASSPNSSSKVIAACGLLARTYWNKWTFTEHFRNFLFIY